jgi:hypothetical protein
MRARLVKVEFLVPEDEPGERDYLTRTEAAQAIQEWFDETGGFGGNFQVTSAETIEDDKAWWNEVWNR